MSSIKFLWPPLRKVAIAALRMAARPMFMSCATMILAASVMADSAAPSAWPDSYQARLEVLALIETLNADLLASHSATETLTEWCAAHHMAAEPKIVAHLKRGIAKPISPAQRQELAIGPDEPIVYRRVDLACGSHVLSQADNWYVPSRLTAAMNAALLSTDTPFGRVVETLHPRRQTLAVKMFWRPLPPGWEMRPPPARQAQDLVIPPLLFEHRALLYSAAGQPISEVDESYTAEILNFRRPR